MGAVARGGPAARSGGRRPPPPPPCPRPAARRAPARRPGAARGQGQARHRVRYGFRAKVKLEPREPGSWQLQCELRSRRKLAPLSPTTDCESCPLSNFKRRKRTDKNEGYLLYRYARYTWGWGVCGVCVSISFAATHETKLCACLMLCVHVLKETSCGMLLIEVAAPHGGSCLFASESRLLYRRSAAALSISAPLCNPALAWPK